MPDLEHLDLRYNNISDATVVEPLDRFEFLRLFGNPIPYEVLRIIHPPEYFISKYKDVKADDRLSLDGVNERIGTPVAAGEADYVIESWRFSAQNHVKENYIDIIYPQLSDMDDGGLQERINQALYETAFHTLSLTEEEVLGLELSVSYEVAFASNKFLSVKIRIYFFENGAAYDNYELHTVNIDMRTGEYLRLNDFFNIDDGFIWAFKNRAIIDSEKYHVIPDAYEYILLDNDEDDLKTSLNELAGYYLTDNYLGIVFVTLRQLGSYAEIIFRYDDIKGYANTGNDIWLDVLPSLFDSDYQQ